MQPPELEKPPADTDGSDLYHHRHGVTVSSDAYRQSYEGATSSPWRDPSYLLEYAGERTAEDPDVLETWVTKVFRVVFAGGELDFGVAWDRLFVAAVAGGVDQLIAQERIGRAVTTCRNEGVAA
jgi:hypothetical protein